jgi:hypothetical protein
MQQVFSTDTAKVSLACERCIGQVSICTPSSCGKERAGGGASNMLCEQLALRWIVLEGVEQAGHEAGPWPLDSERNTGMKVGRVLILESRIQRSSLQQRRPDVLPRWFG